VSLSQIRYQQQYQQIQSSLSPGVGNVASYDTRDATTGRRIVKTADGGEYLTQYLSNAEPGSIALFRPGTVGLSGYINQKSR
jgi:hypothetical protein